MVLLSMEDGSPTIYVNGEYRWVKIKEIQMNKRQKIKLLRNNPQGFFCRYVKAHEAELNQSQQGLLKYVKSKFMSWLPE